MKIKVSHEPLNVPGAWGAEHIGQGGPGSSSLAPRVLCLSLSLCHSTKFSSPASSVSYSPLLLIENTSLSQGPSSASLSSPFSSPGMPITLSTRDSASSGRLQGRSQSCVLPWIYYEKLDPTVPGSFFAIFFLCQFNFHHYGDFTRRNQLTRSTKDCSLRQRTFLQSRLWISKQC